MTYDPYRNDGLRELRKYPDPNRSGAGAGILFGALLLAALGGFAYFYSATDNRSVATNDILPPITQPSTTGSAPAPETTGSSANMPPMPEPKMEPKVKPVE